MFPETGIVLDGKTTRGLSLPARLGADRQKQYQRHCYALACWQCGLFGDLPLAEVKVGNVWIDRAGDDKRLEVQMEPFSPEIVFEATEWIDEVVYAFTHGEEARKEPPREVCAATCGFFGTCRAFETDVEGLLTDTTVVTAMAQYREGLDLEKAGRRLKDQAKAALKETDGYALIDGERFALRWTWVNPTVVPEQHRQGHHQIDLKRLP